MPRVNPPSPGANPRLDVDRYRLREAGAATPHGLRREIERVERIDRSTPRLRPVVAGAWGDDGRSAERSLAAALVELGLIDDRTETGGAADPFSGGHPSVLKTANLGSTGTVTIIGDDRTGTITFQPGGTGIAAGELFTVTFGEARPTTNYIVLISPDESDTAVWTWYVGTRAVGSWTLATTAVLSTAARRIGYRVEGFQPA